MSRQALWMLPLLGAAWVAPVQASVVTINDPAVSSGYTPSYYTNPVATPIETHVIGVYETRSDHSGDYHPLGRAYVNVTGSSAAPVNLVLSAYEPTEWVLSGPGVSNIASVTVQNYVHPGTVVGIDASKVNPVSFKTYAFEWEPGDPLSRSSVLAAAVEAIYHAPITSFSGVYRATSFSVALSVPEPGTAALSMLGLTALLALSAVRARKTARA